MLEQHVVIWTDERDEERPYATFYDAAERAHRLWECERRHPDAQRITYRRSSEHTAPLAPREAVPPDS